MEPPLCALLLVSFRRSALSLRPEDGASFVQGRRTSTKKPERQRHTMHVRPQPMASWPKTAVLTPADSERWTRQEEVETYPGPGRT